MITLYCSGCSIKVAIIQEGSKIRKDSVMLCDICERKRKISDMVKREEKYPMPDFFENIFKGK